MDSNIQNIKKQLKELNEKHTEYFNNAIELENSAMIDETSLDTRYPKYRERQKAINTTFETIENSFYKINSFYIEYKKQIQQVNLIKENLYKLKHKFLNSKNIFESYQINPSSILHKALHNDTNISSLNKINENNLNNQLLKIQKFINFGDVFIHRGNWYYINDFYKAVKAFSSDYSFYLDDKFSQYIYNVESKLSIVIPFLYKNKIKFKISVRFNDIMIRRFFSKIEHIIPISFKIWLIYDTKNTYLSIENKKGNVNNFVLTVFSNYPNESYIKGLHSKPRLLFTLEKKSLVKVIPLILALRHEPYTAAGAG